MENDDNYNSFENIKERAKKIEKLNRASNAHRETIYKEKKSGRVIDHKPRMKSSISVNRGFCTHCGNTIKKSNADDRFCNKCYDKLFPNKNKS